MFATENSIFTQKSSIYKYLANEFNLLNNLLNKPNSNNLSFVLKQIQDEMANSKLEANSSNSNKSISLLNSNTSFNKTSQNKGLSRPNSSLNDSLVNKKY